MTNIYSTTPDDLPHTAENLAKLLRVLADKPKYCAKIAAFLDVREHYLEPAYLLWDDNGNVAAFTIASDATEDALLLRDDDDLVVNETHRSTGGARGAFIEFCKEKPDAKLIDDIRREIGWLDERGTKTFIRWGADDCEIDFEADRTPAPYVKRRATALSDAVKNDRQIRTAFAAVFGKRPDDNDLDIPF